MSFPVHELCFGSHVSGGNGRIIQQSSDSKLWGTEEHLLTVCTVWMLWPQVGPLWWKEVIYSFPVPSPLRKEALSLSFPLQLLHWEEMVLMSFLSWCIHSKPEPEVSLADEQFLCHSAPYSLHKCRSVEASSHITAPGIENSNCPWNPTFLRQAPGKPMSPAHSQCHSQDCRWGQ